MITYVVHGSISHSILAQAFYLTDLLNLWFKKLLENMFYVAFGEPPG